MTVLGQLPGDLDSVVVTGQSDQERHLEQT